MAAPVELFAGSAAPRLRTTGLDPKYTFYQHWIQELQTGFSKRRSAVEEEADEEEETEDQLLDTDFEPTLLYGAIERREEIRRSV